MKKNTSINIILIVGAIASVVVSFLFKNALLSIVVFAAFAGIVIFTQKTLFMANAANTAYKKGKIEKAFKLYEKLIKQKDCPVMVKVTYAHHLMHQKQIAKSGEVLEALDEDKMNGHERFNYQATLAMYMWKQGNSYRAISMYEPLLNEKKSVPIYELLGYILIEAKQYKKALQFNKEAMSLYEGNERIKCNLATSYYYLEQYQEAAELYKALIEDYVRFPEPYYYYGLLLESKEKHKGALKYWKIALEKQVSPLYDLPKAMIQSKIDERT